MRLFLSRLQLEWTTPGRRHRSRRRRCSPRCKRADIVPPATGGQEIHLRRATEPLPERRSLLHQLPAVSLPEQPRSSLLEPVQTR
jgi:hypothetical protein